MLNISKKLNVDNVITKTNIDDIDKNIIGIESFSNVLNHICKTKKRSIILTKFMKDELNELFGKYNTRYKTIEFHYYVWIFSYNDDLFYVFTDKNKGTCFNIKANYDDKKSKSIISFLMKLEEMFLSKFNYVF